MSLVDTWLEAGKAAGLETKTAILAELNEDLGLNVTSGRMYEWRSGVARPSPAVASYMLSMSIMYALNRVKPRLKLTSAEQCLLIGMLSIEKRQSKSDK